MVAPPGRGTRKGSAGADGGMKRLGSAQAMGAPKPNLVHIPTDLLGAVAPKRAAIAVENFQFNNIFDNTAAHTDLNFRYTIPWVEGVRRMVAWLDEQGRIEASDQDGFDDRLINVWQQLGSRMGDEFSETEG